MLYPKTRWASNLLISTRAIKFRVRPSFQARCLAPLISKPCQRSKTINVVSASINSVSLLTFVLGALKLKTARNVASQSAINVLLRRCNFHKKMRPYTKCAISAIQPNKTPPWSAFIKAFSKPNRMPSKVLIHARLWLRLRSSTWGTSTRLQSKRCRTKISKAWIRSRKSLKIMSAVSNQL